jgi:hypothetical protein
MAVHTKPLFFAARMLCMLPLLLGGAALAQQPPAWSPSGPCVIRQNGVCEANPTINQKEWASRCAAEYYRCVHRVQPGQPTAPAPAPVK